MMERNIAFGIVISILLVAIVVLFCMLIVKLHIQKIRKYNHLLFQKDLDFQKALTTTVIETQEQVLDNISRDLHDDAGQQITAINFQLQALKLDSEQLNLVLDPLSQSVKQLSESIRSISHSLNNNPFAGADLLTAIRNELIRLRKYAGIPFEFDAEDSNSRRFTGDEKIVIYRIFQEAVNNILKHAMAGSVTIKIVAMPFMMRIFDNGRGFIPTDKDGGMGLDGMSARAAMIGFSLSIDSEPGKGTMVTLIEKMS